jgi:hypothetical protein
VQLLDAHARNVPEDFDHENAFTPVASRTQAA